MIAVDWGTTSFRAYRLAADSAVLEKRSAALGILNVENGKFAEALESQIGDWLARADGPVVLSGMVGSRQGWLEVPYIGCPAGIAELAGGMREVRWNAHRVWIVPGLSTRDAADVPDVMRGEETQILGALENLPDAAVTLCLPGTHSKWVEVSQRRITTFSTHMTGEVFATMKAHSILGRMMMQAPTDLAAFEAGIRRAQTVGGVLHHLFGVRARGLFGELSSTAAAAYLSGILIGHEVLAATPAARRIYLLGAAELSDLYAHALRVMSISSEVLDPDAAVRGLFHLAQHLPRS